MFWAAVGPVPRRKRWGMSLEDIAMTRSNAREIAVQLIFSLGFSNHSAQEVLDSQLTQSENKSS